MRTGSHDQGYPRDQPRAPRENIHDKHSGNDQPDSGDAIMLARVRCPALRRYQTVAECLLVIDSVLNNAIQHSAIAGILKLHDARS